jgi:hypothetical protein
VVKKHCNDTIPLRGGEDLLRQGLNSLLLRCCTLRCALHELRKGRRNHNFCAGHLELLKGEINKFLQVEEIGEIEWSKDGEDLAKLSPVSRVPQSVQVNLGVGWHGIVYDDIELLGLYVTSSNVGQHECARITATHILYRALNLKIGGVADKLPACDTALPKHYLDKVCIRRGVAEHQEICGTLHLHDVSEKAGLGEKVSTDFVVAMDGRGLLGCCFAASCLSHDITFS